MKKLLFLLFFAAGFALADAPLTQWTLNVNSSNQVYLSAWYADKGSVCSAAAAKVSGQVLTSSTIWKFTGSIVAGGGDSANNCYLGLVHTDGSSGTSWMGYGYMSRSACWDGSTPNTSKPLADQCPVQNACASKTGTAGTVDWPGGYVGADGRVIGSLLPGPSTGSQVNIGGCVASVTDFTGHCASDPSKPYPQLALCTYNTTYTGAAATSSTPTVPPAPSPPSTSADSSGKCPSGTVNGGLDSAGTPICIGTGASSPAAGSTTTTTGPKVTNADGSTSQTTTKTTTNSDGSRTTETTTTTTNADGSTSTTGTVTTSSNGMGQKGTSDQEDKSDLCAKHPELNICKNSTVGGSCGNVTCTGDAIQCAIYRQQQKEYCENTTDNASSTLGKNLLSGADPMQSQISGALAGSTVDLGSTSLDQSGFVGGGGCFPNKSITVLGHSVSVSFTNVCSNITPIRYIVLSCSLLVAYLLVSKSVLQG